MVRRSLEVVDSQDHRVQVMEEIWRNCTKGFLLGAGSVRSLSKLVVGVGGGGPDSSNLSCTGGDVIVGGDLIVDWT